MLRTPLSDLLGLEVPVIQAGMSIFTSPGLAAAVSNAGVSAVWEPGGDPRTNFAAISTNSEVRRPGRSP